MNHHRRFTAAVLALSIWMSTQADAEECLLYSVKPDGSGLRLEVEAEVCPGFSAYGSPNVSRDGTKLIFDASPTNSQFSQAKILVKHLSGELKDQIEDFDFGNCPNWSPDGTRITFSVNSRNQKGFRAGVMIIGADGENGEWICASRLPRWTPDGKSLVVVIRTSDVLKLGKVDLETKEIEPYLEDYTFIEQIRWFPDGKRILAHILDPKGEGARQLVTMNPQGDEASIVKLAEGTMEFAALSFDGKWVSYTMSDPNTGNHIYVVATDGKSEPRKLDVLPRVTKEDFCWLKEDNRIMFNAPGRLPVEENQVENCCSR